MISYDALKKLFPSNPLNPSYFATQQALESSSLLPTHVPSSKYATPDEFRQALDKERNKVSEFYTAKWIELVGALDSLEDEISALEDRDMGGDDVIKEENEDENEVMDDGEADRGETDLLMPPPPSSVGGASPVLHAKPNLKPRPSVLSRISMFGRRRRDFNDPHEADLLEPVMAPSSSRRRSRSRDTLALSTSSLVDASSASGRVPPPRRPRRSSDIESSEHERRTSMSSASSHEHDLSFPRKRYHSLGLVQMDPATVPALTVPNGDGELEDLSKEPVWMWTANNDFATVLRIGFKKRISAVWLEAYALKQYVELNLTAFEKILKK